MLKKWYKKISIVTIMILVISLFMPISLFASQKVLGENMQITAAERIFGSNRYETAAKIAQAGWPGTSDYAVLAAGHDQNLVDALTAAPLAKLHNAPILLTGGEQLHAQAEAELVRLKVKTVYVTSGSQVIKPAVTERLTALGFTVKNLGGSDRFETALNIAKEIAAKEPFQELIISTAFSNADALSAASVAAHKGIPILLTAGDQLPSSVKNYLDGMGNKIRKTYVIGGTKVIGSAVQNALPNPVRAGGANRYETNLEILKLFAADIKPGKIFLANGENAHLVDALAGAPLAALSGSPVILTPGSLPAAAIEYVKLNLLPKTVIALGGEGVVPEAAVSALTGWQTYPESNWIKGPADAGKPETISSNLIINGDRFTLQNAIAEYSIYLQGNNCTLNNVTVKGTIFVDPGQTGEAVLKNVKAGNIVIMSGGQNSIHLENTQAGTLLVTGDSKTRVEAVGTTVIGNTIVTSYAILDVRGGTLGTITVSSEPGKVPEVELRGTYHDPVIIDSEAMIVLGDDTTVDSLQINADAAVSVPVGSSIKTASSRQGVNVAFGGGGLVNGAATSGTLPPPPAGGGPGGPGGPSATVEITAFRVSGLSGHIANANGMIVDLSGLADSTKVKFIHVTASEACTLRLTSFRDNAGVDLSIPSDIDREKNLQSGIENQFDIDILLSGYTVGDDGVSLTSLKNRFPSSDYLNIIGEIYQNGQLKKNVTLKLKIR